MALITSVRCKEFIPNFPSADDTVLANIITAVDAFLKRYLNRDIEATTYDELYHGSGYRCLLLNQYPILKVTGVRTNPQVALQVRNTDTTNSVATVRVTSTGIQLESVKNGTTTTPAEITFASNASITALAASISGVTGWEGSAMGSYGAWASADLKALQGAFDALRGPASLQVHADYLSDYRIAADLGELHYPLGFAQGYQNFRVQYQAGYSSVPADLQQATAELVAAVYLARGQNPNLVSESLGSYSYTLAAQKVFDALSVASKTAIQHYRSYRIVRFQ